MSTRKAPPIKKAPVKKKHPPAPHGFRNERQMRLFIFKVIVVSIAALIVLHLDKISDAFFAQVSGVMIIIFLSVFLGVLCVPFLNEMNEKKIPDWAGMIIIYMIILVFAGAFTFSVVPILTEQFDALTSTIKTQIETLWWQEDEIAESLFAWLPDWLRQWNTNLMQVFKENFWEIWESITTYISDAIKQANNVVIGVTNVVVQFILILTFAFFFAIERHKIHGFFHDLLPTSSSKYIRKREGDMVNILFSWLRGQIILGLSIFISTWVGLFILKLIGIEIPRMFALAFIAGLTEFIPYIGPIIALIPAIIVSVTLGWKAVIAVIILYFIIQRLENNLLVPLVMSKALDISPFTVLLVMLIWATLFGIVWVLIAIPVSSILSIFVKDWIRYRKQRDQEFS